MANWFKKICQSQPKAKWSFSVEASVFVPANLSEEMERTTAESVLRTTLARVEGDTSSHTAVDSNVMFDIQFEPLKIS